MWGVGGAADPDTQVRGRVVTGFGTEGLLDLASPAPPQTGKAGFKKGILKLVKNDTELYKIITGKRDGSAPWEQHPLPGAVPENHPFPPRPLSRGT